MDMDRRLIVIGLITSLVFGGIPILVTLLARVRWSSGFALRRPATGTIVGAVLLGVSLWPIAHEMFLFSKLVGLSALGKEQKAVAETMLAQMRNVPVWLIILSMGLIPAVFEELSFRGFLFSALRTKLGGAGTVAASSVLFGVFHEILIPGRMLVSTFLGVVLGWVRLRSNSILPGILMHATHNSLLLTIAYYRDEIIAYGWDVQDELHLPGAWIAGAAIGIVLGIGAIVASTRRNESNRE
jgi:ABC-2 type transport system permease protein/sodium transport system permease protein